MTSPTASRDLLDRPTAPGALLAMVAGVATVALLIEGAGQWQALVAEIAGLGLCVGGYVAWQRGQKAPGSLAALAGGVLVLVALGLAVSRPEAVTDRLELLPGLLGLAVLLAGLVPVRSGWERRLVTAGAALLFVGVVTSGVVRGASEMQLLVAGVASVLAWDLGEQSVSLGGQVGRRAQTHRAELVHAGGSLLAGVAILGVTLGVAAMDVQGLSLAGFAVLLVAGFALVVAMRQ
ncbi:hypothetical protein SAMN05216559_0771 [Halomicrobium zhouii]|uniref:Uncharacterized protein n=1 Tax=Halomicrobium zhouii TaxID=767519 RepID=A0A1I6KGH2_9EURY|nr:hypothetical protein [Halomicrobium zhouii]SFR90254.1 hypothetical protein SAMN05216559_0771 [Halomicrobium zhouii]